MDKYLKSLREMGFSTVTADDVRPPTKPEPPREETLRSSDWVEALARRWERKIYLESDPYTDDDYKMGATSQLINCVNELRAEMASASTGAHERDDEAKPR